METFKPLIFISHSAKDATARGILVKLYRKLSRRFEVLLDRERLGPNDKWRHELHTWMSLCHGAVVLFSKDAMENSPWVKKEATFLSIRRDMDDQFALIPVLTPDVTHEELEGGDFRPLAINEIQMAAGETADEIAEHVLQALEPLAESLSEETAMQSVENVLASALSEVERKDAMLLLRAGAMLGRPLQWKSNRSRSAQLARALLSADIGEMTEAILFLAPHLDVIKEEAKKKASRLLDLLAPFWVDPDAVAELALMNKRPRRQRAVTVNGVEYPFTGRCYIQRACGRTYDWVHANITFPEGQQETPTWEIGAVETEIMKTLMRAMGYEDGEKVSPQAFADYFNELEQKEPFFILVPKDFDATLLGKLREKFEAFTFFLLEGEGAPDQQRLAANHVILLKPELKPGQDREISKLFRDTRGKFNRMR